MHVFFGSSLGWSLFSVGASYVNVIFQLFTAAAAVSFPSRSLHHSILLSERPGSWLKSSPWLSHKVSSCIVNFGLVGSRVYMDRDGKMKMVVISFSAEKENDNLLNLI